MKTFDIKLRNGNSALIKTYKCKHFYVSACVNGIYTPFVRMTWNNIIVMLHPTIDAKNLLANLIQSRGEL